MSSSYSSSSVSTWSFSVDGFDDEKFKSYYKTFDYVLNRLGNEVSALSAEVNILLCLFNIFENLKSHCNRKYNFIDQ